MLWDHGFVMVLHLGLWILGDCAFVLEGIEFGALGVLGQGLEVWIVIRAPSVQLL